MRGIIIRRIKLIVSIRWVGITINRYLPAHVLHLEILFLLILRAQKRLGNEYVRIPFLERSTDNWKKSCDSVAALYGVLSRNCIELYLSKRKILIKIHCTKKNL